MCPRPALDQHFEIELLRRQPLQGVPAEGAKTAFVDVVQQAIFQIGVAQLARVVFAKHALYMCRGQDFAYDAETFEYKELLIELLFELALPLESQVGRRDDENTFGKAAKVELADQQAGHDRFARARVVNQQERMRIAQVGRPAKKNSSTEGQSESNMTNVHITCGKKIRRELRKFG